MSVALLPWLVACSATGLRTAVDEGDAPPGAPSVSVAAIPPPPPDERCNGADDDDDGRVDESFGDIDGDGVADCVDVACTVDVPPAGSVAVDPACAGGGPPLADPWDVVIERHVEGIEAPDERGAIVRHASAAVAPVVANLTDDNGDGWVDHRDVPEIVVVMFRGYGAEPGYLVAIDGGTGEVVLTSPGWLPFGGIAAGDIDGDDRVEIVGFDADGRPRALRADGSSAWDEQLVLPTVGTREPLATLADLDGDGRVEVLAHDLVLDGATGRLLHDAHVSGQPWYGMPVAGDIDLDGRSEVILGATVLQLERRGEDVVVSEEWSTPVWGAYGHWAAILDADGDPEGEVAVVGDGRLVIHEHDGSVALDVAAGSDRPGPPCVGDFDGDGQSEIAWASEATIQVVEVDGRELWWAPVEDATGLAGCSGYDFDGDGALELAFADERTLYLFDGGSGEVLYRNEGHTSATLFEYPVVADVDRDGSAELIVASSPLWASGWAGLTVLGHALGGWTASGRTWHVHDYAVTNVSEDGRVGTEPEPPWQTHNMVRARPTSAGSHVDLEVDIHDVCISACEGVAGVVALSVQVSNTGSSASRRGVPVSLYAPRAGRLELLDVQTLEDPVPAGGVSAGVVFEVPAHDGFVVRVDDDGASGQRQDECDEADNEMVFVGRLCPRG